MELSETLLYHGCNRRGDCTFIEQLVVLDETEQAALAAAMSALGQNLAVKLATLGVPGECLPGLDIGDAEDVMVAFARTFTSLALALQRATGHRVARQGLLPDSSGEGVWAWFEYEHEEVGLTAAGLSLRVLSELVPELTPIKTVRGEMGQFSDCNLTQALQRFFEFSRPLVLPKDAEAFIKAADRLDIPCAKLDRFPYHGVEGELRIRQNGLLKFGHCRHQHITDGTICIDRCEELVPLINDREALRQCLLDAGIPVPRRDPSTGNCLMTKRAIRAAANVGYPVVVKPGRRGRGAGLSLGLGDDGEVRSAVDQARRVSNTIYIEGMVPGESNRLLVANHRLIGLIVGGGEQSLESIHPLTVAVAEKLSRQLGTGMLVLDVVTTDISMPLAETGGAGVDLDLAPELDGLLAAESALHAKAAESFLHWLYPQEQASRIPIVAVTGTNGKTTTCRMIARIMQRAGYHTGLGCTDGVYIEERFEGKQDEIGEEPYLHIFERPEVDFAILEEWFGRICRAGFNYSWSDVAVCLNVTNDHLGRIGTHDLEQMAEVKSAVAARARQAVVLNADDPLCLAMAPRMDARTVCLVSSHQSAEQLGQGLQQKLCCCVVESINGVDWIVIHDGGRRLPIAPVNSLPATFNGDAIHNVSNALHAAAASYLSGAKPDVIREGLQSFHMDIETTPGRLNIYNDLPFRVIMDYAHNTDGYRKLSAFVDRQPARGRRIVMAAIVGERKDREVLSAATALAGHFDHYVCRNYAGTKCRPLEEIPALLKSGLRAAGVAENAITMIPEASGAIDFCLNMATSGDLLVLLTGDSEIESTWEMLRNFSYKE